MSILKYKKVAYPTFAIFPSKKAHSIQIMNMCHAMSAEGLEVTLLGDFCADRKELSKHYHLATSFKMISNWVAEKKRIARIVCLLKSFGIILKNRPDIVYTRDVYHCLLGCLIMIVLGGRVYYEIHETMRSNDKRIIFQLILKSNKLQRVIFISETLYKDYNSNYAKQLRKYAQIIAHDGVDATSFTVPNDNSTIRSSLNIPKNCTIVGYTGSLYPEKGAHLLPKLAAMLPAFYFLIVGGTDSQVENLRRKVRAADLENVILTGYQAYEKIPSYLAACDILVMPYQDTFVPGTGKITTESMSPLKLFEYMASRKPIVASRLAEIEEVLENNINAILVEPNDLDQWVISIRRLANDAELSKMLSSQALQDVKQYSWRNRVNRIFSEEDGLHPCAE